VKRTYNYSTLSRETGFDERQLEKVCRISDVLEDISGVPFLRDRLSLYGGTSLSFIHFDELQRLSVDLDFNYRHLDADDWGETRKRVDDGLKRILYSQGYTRDDVSISPSYPLARFTVRYRNNLGTEDSFLIEVGYMRRIPLLRSDEYGDFRHIGLGRSFKVKTPVREELFANKWCTCLYRGSSRDLFDVARIAEMGYDRKLFLRCAVVDSLMRGEPRLHMIDADALVEPVRLDSRMRNLLRMREAESIDFDAIKAKVLQFTKDILSSLTREEIEVIEKFHEERTFNPELIDTGIFNTEIASHPMILRALAER